jgi:hypothetical protein
MWVCPASPLSTRRYEYIEYENGKVLGEKKSCSLGTTKVRVEGVSNGCERINDGFEFTGGLVVAVPVLALQLLHVHL